MIDSDKLSAMLREFAAARQWEQFHTPKNLAGAISIESAELQEIFQWSRGQDGWADLRQPDIRRRVEEELADVFLYVVRFADLAGIDLQNAAEKKMILNAEKYPVEVFRGSDRKYNEEK